MLTSCARPPHLHWLQKECPRDAGVDGSDAPARGYPELQPASNVVGTPDGLAKALYVLESRRIVALERLVEQDIARDAHPAACAWPSAAVIDCSRWSGRSARWRGR